MSTDPNAQAQPQTAEATTQEASILDQMVSLAPKTTEKSRMEGMLGALVEEAMKGTVTWDKSLTKSVNSAISALDDLISKQLAAIMHHEKFRTLEGTYRGLHHLVMNSETSATLKIRLLNINKRELFKDLDSAVEFDQSQIFKKIYEYEFGTPGGEPYGALIGDYQFSNHPDDISLLSKMSNVSAAAFCPFLTAPSPQMFGMESWTELSKPRDLEKIFDSVEYAQWKSFRESEDSRFVSLSMPRVLARLPYGSKTKPIDEFGYEEAEFYADGKAKQMSSDNYCWMNAAYVLGTRMTNAFSKYGFCTAIRGIEGGGKVEGLPAHIFTSEDGDPDMQCPTEIGLTERRENELSKLGFMALCHWKNTDYAAFLGGQTAQKPKKYDRPEATANAAISARLPYIMATGRFAHYLKVLARDKIGSFMEVTDCQDWLDRWIHNYVSADNKPTQEAKAKYPLREAKVEVKEIPGKPGSYNAVCYLRPWLQMEELTASMRMVARIPQKAG